MTRSPAGRCDPHPTRTSGAALPVGALPLGLLVVAILTRRERRVQRGILISLRRHVMDLLRSSPDANVGCSGRRSTPGSAGTRRCDPHPTRTSGAARRSGGTQGGAGCCDPHPTRTSVAACGISRPALPSFAWLRSSPDANVGCSVSRRLRGFRCRFRLRSSPDVNVGCSSGARSGWTGHPGCCDPHPTRTSGAAVVSADRRRPTTAGCDPHPTRTSGAALHLHHRPPVIDGHVAILTRRERRVQPSGCWPTTLTRLPVAILTRRERRVQQAAGLDFDAVPFRVAILTRRERRVQPWLVPHLNR